LSCLPVNGKTFTYTYNGRGDRSGVSNPYSETIRWSYYFNEWMQQQTLNNGATTSFTYDPIGQLLDLSNKKSGGTVLSDYNSTGSGHYDGAGNLLARSVVRDIGGQFLRHQSSKTGKLLTTANDQGHPQAAESVEISTTPCGLTGCSDWLGHLWLLLLRLQLLKAFPQLIILAFESLILFSERGVRVRIAGKQTAV